MRFRRLLSRSAASSTRHIPPSLGGPKRVPTLRAEIEAICRQEGGYPDHWPQHAACPACGKGPLVPAFAKYGFAHARCGTCDFICVDPYPTDKILKQLYSGAYYSSIRELFERPNVIKGGAATPFSAPQEVLERAVERTTQGRRSGSWLDVGGGIGTFANLVHTLKPNWTVKLNELNPQSISIARELFDFEIVNADPGALARSDERFDVVSSVSVLEHVTHPHPFLKSYFDLIKPDGWLLLIIPHFTPLNGHVSGPSSPNVVPPYHVSLFGEVALRRLLERLESIEIVAIEQAGPAAFQLIHHVDFGDNWDIEVPTPERPEPRSVQVMPYDPAVSQALNVLAEADQRLGDYFAEHDGRLYLVAYCRKRGSRAA